MQTTVTETKTFTEAQATDEAVLLLTRKLMRLHPEAYADIWRRLPDGAKTAIFGAERRADKIRDEKDLKGIAYDWAADEDDEN